MKKIIILTLLLVFACCFPLLAAEEKVLAENKIMVFKYKVIDNAKIGDKFVELNVYDRETKKKLTSDSYIYEGLNNTDVQIKKDSHGMAFNPTSQIVLKLENDGYAFLKITYIKNHDLILKLKPTEKKVFVFAVQE